MRVLGIESSCDETGAAVVEDGRFMRSNVVATQIAIHQRYGGVVPEVASRQQLSAIIPVLESALEQAGVTWGDLDGIAVTYGPGLAGSLLVGLTAAKALALAHNLPLLGVNHLEAHIYANWLRPDASAEPTADAPVSSADDERPGDPAFPLLALVISGAHSELVHIPRHGRYELLGQTRDDAAGEAFDKVARVLGLGYPGGPAVERVAAIRDAAAPNPYTLPRAWLPGTHDFSFSGLKTAVLQVVEGAQSGEAERGRQPLRARGRRGGRHRRRARRARRCRRLPGGRGRCAGDEDAPRRPRAGRAPGACSPEASPPTPRCVPASAPISRRWASPCAIRPSPSAPTTPP